jgi:hypothetical protein
VRKILDKIFNFYLNIKSRYRRFFNVKPRKRHRPLCISELIYFDNFRTLNLEDWHIGQPWGEYHPEALYQYYPRLEDRMIEASSDGLKLWQKHIPKTFTINDQTVEIPHGVGLVVSNKSFGYGYFECDATLPNGNGLWPAIWLSDHKTWPPEIDILEAYSDGSANYCDKLESNVHYGISGVNKGSSGAGKHPLPNVMQSHRYATLWTKNRIEFYYDGFLVRRITDKSVLQWFNKPDVRMLWILNNAIRKDLLAVAPEQSLFVVHNVKVYSLK